MSADPLSDIQPVQVDAAKLLQSIVDVVCVFDENGVFRYVTPSSIHLFGYAPEEMVGASFRSFIYPADIEKTIALVLERQHDCRTSNFRNRYCRKDGSVVPVIWSGRWDAADRLLYCVARDGSEQAEVEQRLHKAQEMAGVASFEYDEALGAYTHVSDTLYAIFGLDKVKDAPFTRELLWSMLHPGDKERVMKTTLQTDHFTTTLEYRILRPDGQLVYVHGLRERVYDADGRQVKVIGTIQDITERKTAELAVQQSEERFRSLVQNGNDLIGVIDMEGTYTFVSENVKQHLGFDAEDLVGQNAFQYIHPDDREEVLAQLPLISGKDLLVIGPFRFRNGRGEWRWMETSVSNHLENPAICGLVTNSKDITEKKRKEDELRWSEQRFQSLVLNGSDLIVIIDEGSNFHYVSDNVTAVLGYAPGELLGHPALQYIHPDDCDHVAREIRNILQGQELTNGVQHRFRHKGGHWVWLESKGSNHQGNDRIGGLLVNSRNIDERVKLQHRLSQELLNKQKEITSAVIRAQETERSQLGRELHDNVNQVLTTVKLYNEMYLTGYVTDKELLVKSTAYVQDCINEIRSISKRLSAPTLGKISLYDSIKELVDSINLTRRLEVRFRAQGIGAPVSEDLHLSIYRIVQESLNNIIKYSGAELATVEIVRHANELCLKVGDNGKGFDPQVKRQGIGITNMKTRAENLNASFRLHSAPGQGCRIEICFPLAEPLPLPH